MKYLVLNCLFCLTLVPLWPTIRQLNRAALCGALVVVCVLTAVFDPILVAVHIIDYDQRAILGLKVFGAPIEDFFYAAYAVLCTSALWEKLGGHTNGRS